MGRALFVVFVGLWFVLGSLKSYTYAEEMLGGEPREFHVAILSSGKVSFILPSTIVVDEKVKLKPLELIVTNDTNHTPVCTASQVGAILLEGAVAVVPRRADAPILPVGASLPSDRGTLTMKRRRLTWHVGSHCSGESF